MNVLVTGATGFVGQHLVGVLLQRGHTVTAVGRRAERGRGCAWFGRVRFVEHDIGTAPAAALTALGPWDLAVHLAWPELDDYRSLSHIEVTLPAHYQFLKALVLSGVGRLLVTGTCFEYGMQDGRIEEETPARPELPYAVAKDSLHRHLIALQKVHPFNLRWARLFYLYGPGQRRGSLLAQLDRAIDAGDAVFDMSPGDQQRDFLPVEEVAALLALAGEAPSLEGPINICSGKPVSVRRLVEEHVRGRNASIRLNLGHYPYPSHEPFAFWGDSAKMARLASAPEVKP